MSSKKIISTTEAPAAIGPYSQAVSCNGMIYCSGQIPLNPETMEIVGETAAEQAEQVMKNLGKVLEAAGSNFSKVVKCSIFLDTMDDFGAVNEVYGGYFDSDPPARETVAVQTLPKNVLVEISCIAYS
ncbi:MAG TPA: reactive intermediate/imine deaminase [Balneolaceae bacterium]|nr:reactive intermediate/imine deaminase [Balneolaceae bacterium]|tara:strand:- start:28410 stop:28793 length:384 start_codon:yes stop_codon:yes gene_type:complete